MLAHPDQGICNIECSPSLFYPEYNQEFLYHANHILNEEMAVNDTKKDDPASSTLSRYLAMGSLIEKYHGEIDISLARQMLSDHTGYPKSICAHPHADAIYSKTLASMIFYPKSGCMEIAFGNGCEMPYETHSLRHSYHLPHPSRADAIQYNGK
jgi:hypothetical protein